MNDKEMRVPLQMVIYGQAGVGKTTFAKLSKDAFFVDLENGSIGIPSAQKKAFPIIGHNEASKKSMLELNKFLDNALKSEAKPTFKTLVIDSLTRIDEYMEREVIAEQIALGNKKMDTLGDMPYGAGYALVKNKVMNIVNKCIALSIQKGMDLVLITHSKDKQIKKLGQETYDTVQPRLSKGAMSTIIELVPFCFYLGKDVIKDKKGMVTQLYTDADTFCENVKRRIMLDHRIYDMTAGSEEEISKKASVFWQELYEKWDKANA